MTPHEALQYIAQLSGDYVRQLPPSAAMPTQQLAQEAINMLSPLVEQAMAPPPDPAERRPRAVRAVRDPELGRGDPEPGA